MFVVWCNIIVIHIVKNCVDYSWIYTITERAVAEGYNIVAFLSVKPAYDFIVFLSDRKNHFISVTFGIIRAVNFVNTKITETAYSFHRIFNCQTFNFKLFFIFDMAQLTSSALFIIRTVSFLSVSGRFNYFNELCACKPFLYIFYFYINSISGNSLGHKDGKSVYMRDSAAVRWYRFNFYDILHSFCYIWHTFHFLYMISVP